MSIKKSKLRKPALTYIQTVKAGYFPGDRIKRELVLAISEDRFYISERASQI